MPDWTFFRDRDGNKYYFDKAYKIVITDEPAFNYPPVSESGIDYYYNSGIEYVKKGKIAKGLYFFKSILALKSQNNRLRKIQINSAEQIKLLSGKHGTRMNGYNRGSTLLIVKDGSKFRIINENLFYSMELPFRPGIIREGWKYSGKGYALKFGINLNENSKKSYDYMAGVETRLLPYSPQSIDHAQYIWEMEVGPDAFSRELFIETKNSRIYKYKYPGDSPFRGYEGIYAGKGMVHLVRIMYHEKMEAGVKDSVEDIIKGITIVK
jgi:hypothetical protein